MRSVKTITLLAVSLAMAGAAYAWNSDGNGNIRSGGGAASFLMAQQNPNPTNDPDVQRGIDQRLEQERQARIDACVQQQEANMSAAERLQEDEQIRNNCTSREPAVAGVRG